MQALDYNNLRKTKKRF